MPEAEEAGSQFIHHIDLCCDRNSFGWRRWRCLRSGISQAVSVAGSAGGAAGGEWMGEFSVRETKPWLSFGIPGGHSLLC